MNSLKACFNPNLNLTLSFTYLSFLFEMNQKKVNHHYSDCITYHEVINKQE